jgi:hypothetical protein
MLASEGPLTPDKERDMHRVICNVFTIAMAPDGGCLEYQQITPEEAYDILAHPREEEDAIIVQAVGHEQTAQLANNQLGGNLIQFNRCTVKLLDGDELILCQYVGPRLPEGVTVLPEGAEIRWYRAYYTQAYTTLTRSLPERLALAALHEAKRVGEKITLSKLSD